MAGHNSGKQAYPESVGQKARDEDRGADGQDQKTIETIGMARAVARIQAVNDRSKPG